MEQEMDIEIEKKICDLGVNLELLDEKVRKNGKEKKNKEKQKIRKEKQREKTGKKS